MLWRYLAAVFYDVCIILALFLGMTAILVMARSGNSIAPGSHWYQCLLVLMVYVYYMGSMTYGGQTIGLKAWRLQLVAPAGKPLILALHQRLFWFWVAFFGVKWRTDARAKFLFARGAARLHLNATQ